MNRKLLIPLITVLASCSSHHSGDEPLDTSGTAITLGATTSSLAWEGASLSRSDADARAGRPRSLFADARAGRAAAQSSAPRVTEGVPLAVTPETIGVLGYMTGGAVFDNQEMYWTGGETFTSAIGTWDYNSEWAYTPVQFWSAGENYLFYAYAPWLPDTQVTATESNLAGFQLLTLSDLPLYGTEDYMVAQAIHAYTCTRASGNAHVPFTLEHLTARVRFCYREGEDYAELRTIRLKSMTVSDPGDRYSVTVDFSTGTREVTYSLNEPASTARAGRPRSLFANTRAGSVTTLLNEGGVEYIDLNTTEYQPLASAYVLPLQATNTFEIIVTYDTLDRAGVVTRSGVTNTSQITINTALQAGCYYDVNILVAPDYLYVLSDNDPTVDGYIIINE
ncbi:MAG: fimbrillin family protein [Bacteroidales bacterium]|nr:fimbrillin family protein [Bacteroidales bacterium]